jgi:hypothetical protein
LRYFGQVVRLAGLLGRPGQILGSHDAGGRFDPRDGVAFIDRLLELLALLDLVAERLEAGAQFGVAGLGHQRARAAEGLLRVAILHRAHGPHGGLRDVHGSRHAIDRGLGRLAPHFHFLGHDAYLGTDGRERVLGLPPDAAVGLLLDEQVALVIHLDLVSRAAVAHEDLLDRAPDAPILLLDDLRLELLGRLGVLLQVCDDLRVEIGLEVRHQVAGPGISRVGVEGILDGLGDFA